MATYLNLDQTRDFHENGYVIVKNFFNKEETVLLQNASKKLLKQDVLMKNQNVNMQDSLAIFQ